MIEAQLGRSGPMVSRLSLGSWRTYERMSRPQGVSVMKAAQDAGITFLDDARYNDELGTAPIPTGYSEVVFGELFRAATWRRPDVVLANKLWWEFWPDQTPADELDASLDRMGFESVDLIYTDRPPEGLEMSAFIEAIVGLIGSGKATCWGALNWPASLVLEAASVCDRDGLLPMAAHQLPYSVAHRTAVEDPAMVDAHVASGTSVVASFVLAGGVLSGKYDADPSSGRAAGTLDHPRVQSAISVARELGAIARSLDTEPATLAIAFALLHPSVATVLFGATHPEQVHQNVAALELLARLDDDSVARIRSIGR